MTFRKHRTGRRALQVGTSFLLISLLAACERPGDKPGEKASVEAEPTQVSACPSDEKLTTYCGFQNPEDLALMPDGGHLVVTGFGGMPPTAAPGTLYLFDLATETATEPEITLAENTWGDPACLRDTKVFSPHGLGLVQRSGERYELAITNHLPRETIELFELAFDKDSTWSLTWRGCVDAPANKFLNDVTLTRGGDFYATSMLDADMKPEEFPTIAAEKSDTGSVWHWTRNTDGASTYEELPGTNGSFPNGIDLSGDEATLYINYWLSGKTVKYNLETEQVEHTHTGGFADNLTVIDGDVWAAKHDHTLEDMAACPPELAQCLLPFTIHVLSGEDLSVKQAWSFNSSAFGVATVAIPVGDKVWLGTHHGDRMASFER